MISVAEAKAIINTCAAAAPPQIAGLAAAAGYTLAADLYAPCDVPAFHQSNMDGYALSFADREQSLAVIGEVAAGAAQPVMLRPGTAVRIFTGAPVPEGADTVVMQERVHVSAGMLQLTGAALQPGDNVRLQGSEVKRGARAMSRGTRLTPAALGYLAGIGIAEVPIYAAPKVALILTGDELTLPGSPLPYGQVYESGSFMLTAALRQAGVQDVCVLRAADDLDQLKDTLAAALAENDLVLLTGGVSVGDYDFVVRAALACGVTQQLHRVKQRPGKPLFFGARQDKLVFGLPGNPSSGLVCFYEYVLPALETRMQQAPSIREVQATLALPYAKAPGLTHFLKGHYAAGIATPLHAQQSFRLQSFAQANCLIVLDEARSDYAAGETVTVHLIPL